MVAYGVRRFLAALPVIFLVTVLVFAIMHVIPGDPTAAMVGAENMDPAVRERLIREFGLDRPLPVQYLSWIKESATGNFGVSFRTREPVLNLMLDRITATAHVAILAWILGTSVAVMLGILAATHRNQKSDVILSFVAMLGVATPSFFAAILLIYVFTIEFSLLPPSGFDYIWDDPLSSFEHLILPVLALSWFLMASLMRQVRSSVLEVLNLDYVRTARSKGLKDRTVVYGHVLRNALLPVVTVLGLQLSHILGGSVIIETMFAIPGFGRLLLDSIRNNDTPTLQGVVLVMGLLVVGINLLVDISYTVLDPRIRSS